MSGQDAEIADLRAKLAEAERQRDDARAEAREHNESHVTVADLLTVAQSRAERAEAACAEMRAALEDAANELRLLREKDGAGPYDPTLRARITVLLARTDLGRGMVAVPREVVERAQTVVGWYVDNGRGLPHGTRIGEKLLCDLDALLDGGKVKP